MLNRMITKKNAVIISAIAVLLYASLDMLFYLMDITVLRIIAFAVIGIAVCFMIICCGTGKIRIGMGRNAVILITFYAWYLIGCVVRNGLHQADFAELNRLPLMDTAVTLFLILPLGSFFAEEAPVSRTLSILKHGILMGWSVFMLVVLITVFRGGIIPTLNGGMIGMKDYQFLYLNCYYNTTGMIELVFTLLCFFMVIDSKPRVLKIIYICLTLINFAVITLSNSRTATYSAMIGIALMSGAWAYLSFLKRYAQPKRSLFAVGCAILSGLILYLLRQGIFQWYLDTVKLFSGDVELTISGRIRDLSDSTVMTFTGRTDIWKYAIKGMVNNPYNAIFGVTPYGVIELITQISDGKWDVYTHNQFLEIGVSNGFPGLILMGTWFVLLLKDIWKLVRNQKQYLAVFVSIIILTLGLANFFEATLMYYGYIAGYLFFFLSGYIHGKAAKIDKERDRPKTPFLKKIYRSA